MMKKIFEENKGVLNDFLARLRREETHSAFDRGRNDTLRIIVEFMVRQPKEWDELCPVNISFIGDNFIQVLSAQDRELSKSLLDSIATMCFRFLLELDLSTQSFLDRELEYAKNFVIQNADTFSPDEKIQIDYALRSMPIAVCKRAMNIIPFEDLKEFNHSFATAKLFKENWDQELSEKEEQISKLKNVLERYKTAFNFVGLYDGFDELAKEKMKEKGSVLCWLRVLGVLAIVPIIAEPLYINFYRIEPVSMQDLSLIIPTISAVIILVYYFRVLLFNYKSVKSQLIQIELRKTLCRFIQSYADYSGKLKGQSPEALDKFERIVFSEIVADEGNLPATHDGIEQIGKTIKELMKK